ncbi:MAG: hypothetical protein IJ608_06170 [Lachnospiraceae bacterium]|nr:hypothetical protein [Lachnospiraceae bacterium]
MTDKMHTSDIYTEGCDSRELFAPFKIARAPEFEEKLNKYNVIKIDMNSEYQNVLDKNKLLLRLIDKIKDEMREAFPEVKYRDDDSLRECGCQHYTVYEYDELLSYKKRFVYIFDTFWLSCV